MLNDAPGPDQRLFRTLDDELVIGSCLACYPDDLLFDSGYHLERGVVAGMGDFDEHGSIPLVNDTSHYRDRRLTDTAREFAVVEPCQVADSPATADHGDGVGAFQVGFRPLGFCTRAW